MGEARAGGKGKGRKYSMAKNPKAALALYVRKRLGSDGMGKALGEVSDGGKDKALTKEMFRGDAKAIVGMSPSEFGFAISRIGEGNGKGNGNG